MADELALSVQGLYAGYGQGNVLENVDIVVPAGSVTGLLGPNGAGKTTLLRVAAGNLRPSQGRVVRLGVEDASARPESAARAGVCHIPEGRGIFPNLTVRENLRVFFGPRDLKDGIERVTEVFPALAPRMRQVAGSMSGGEQQMLAMCRAFVPGVKLILVDEASMGLAPIVVDLLYAAMLALNGEGVAFLIVEQFFAKVLAIADSVYVLSRGRVAFHGEPSEFDEEELFGHYIQAPGRA